MSKMRAVRDKRDGVEIERLPLDWQGEGDGGLVCVRTVSSTEGVFCNQYSQDLTVYLLPMVKVIFSRTNVKFLSLLSDFGRNACHKRAG